MLPRLPLLFSAAVSAVSASAPSASAPYVLDTSFALPFPAGVQRVTALSPSLTPGGSQLLFALQRAVAVPFLCRFASSGAGGVGTWSGGCDEGANNVTMESPHGAAPAGPGAGADLLVTDISGGTVKRFSQAGALLATGGTQGRPGTGLNPIQFSAPADVAVTGAGVVVVSDGDGGDANRVVALRSASALNTTVWVVGRGGAGAGEFSSPHSVAYDAGTDVLFVADRGNARIVLLAPATGATLATWAAADCFPGGVPWGLRVDGASRRLVVADGAHMSLMVFDLGAAAADADAAPPPPACRLAANISVPAALCGVPHELAIMPEAPRDVYRACVGGTVPPTAGPTSVLRFAEVAVAGRPALRGGA